MELFASACVLSRWDHDLASTAGSNGVDASSAAEWFVTDSLNRAEQSLNDLSSTLDHSLLQAAQSALQAR